MAEPIEKRLFTGAIVDTNGCVNFGGYITELGYGRLKFNGIDTPAHRVAWILRYGEIKYNLLVLHKCDNRRCINTDHLFLGTQLDNMRDMAAKGKWPDRKGASNGNAWLSEQKVQEIRALLAEGHMTQAEIGELYKIAQTTVSYIKRVGWKHLKAGK